MEASGNIKKGIATSLIYISAFWMIAFFMDFSVAWVGDKKLSVNVPIFISGVCLFIYLKKAYAIHTVLSFWQMFKYIIFSSLIGGLIAIPYYAYILSTLRPNILNEIKNLSTFTMGIPDKYFIFIFAPIIIPIVFSILSIIPGVLSWLISKSIVKNL